MIDPSHHQHIRKRIHLKKERYPHPKPLVKWFDRLIIVAGVATVVATIPQVLEIWINQSAENISTITWMYYTLYTVLFAIYGFIHKAFPIVFNYSVGALLYGMIAVGSVLY